MIARLRAAKRPDNKPATIETKNGQAVGLAVLEPEQFASSEKNYFAAVGSGTGVSASVCR